MLKCKIIITILALIIGNVAPAHAASWTVTGSMATANFYHSATLLLNGKVLVALGKTNINDNTYIKKAEVYNPTNGTWLATGSPINGSVAYTTTILANGKVLVVGGLDLDGDNNGRSTRSQLYDPVTEVWTTTGSLTTGRYGHNAIRLANGKVLVVGGIEYETLNSAELYDPVTGQWSVTGSLAMERVSCSATLLPNGKVLVVGGYNNTFDFNFNSELFDPTTGQWSATSALTTPRAAHAAILLATGKVLVAGGIVYDGAAWQNVTSVELYDPASGQWSQMGNLVIDGTVTLLANGKLLVVGGLNATLYDPATGQSSQTVVLATERAGHSATLLNNGRVLVAGGYNSTGNLASAELYTYGLLPTTTTLTSSRNPSSLNQSVTFTAKVTATPVPTGTVTFKVDGVTKSATSLNNGQTTYTTTNLTLGNRLIRAEYAGNSTWAASAAQLTQTVSTGADFVITNLSMNPVAPAANQTFTVRGVVKNTSTVAGAAGNLSLWLDKAAAAGCNAAADKVIPIGTLAAAASKAFSVNFTAAAASGTKTLRAFIDSACATVETNESNNQVTKIYTVGAPDLTVTSITLTPAAPVTGATFTAKVVVKNQGAIPINSSFFLDLWLDKSTTQTCGAAGGLWATINALAAGASQTITFSGLSVATAGSKTLRVYADSWCETADASRSNNQLTKSYTVADSADFVVNSVTLIPSSPAANSTFTAIVVVTNQGTTSGNGGNLTIWTNQSTTQSCNATGDKVVTVGTLAAGATSALTVTGLSAGSAGAKKLRAFVDSACATSEANEVNNQLMQSYTVQ